MNTRHCSNKFISINSYDLHKNSRVGYYYTHFTDERTEAQGAQGTCR